MFSIPTTRTVLKAGWVTGVTSTIVCLCIRALAWIFRVPFEVKPLVGSGPLQSVPWLLVFAVPLAAGMIVSLVAAIFLGVRRAAGWVTTLGTLAFLGLVYLALSQPPAVLWSTRIWLAVMIVLTWLIVVPQVARVVGDGDPKLAAAYRTLPSPEVTPGA
ncbi:MAG: hypothetical protein U0990_01565 [Candidatus Nanopelagicales bacterium]|nr:hypothetical protein [Candidatus Nanopelagicales bacterium]MDZ4248759.1 hypothetical protein [Candidatus Nanopelagicales bacterium]MDZ7577143.1 hypothetical protein [Candidatus Nanopelagicales bacterium]